MFILVKRKDRQILVFPFCCAGVEDVMEHTAHDWDDEWNDKTPVSLFSETEVFNFS